MRALAAIGCFALLAATACERGPLPSPEAAQAVADAGWPVRGRTPDEQRHSPLAQIHRRNVDQLGVVVPDLRFSSRGVHESWPAIVIGGALSSRGMAGWLAHNACLPISWGTD